MNLLQIILSNLSNIFRWNETPTIIDGNVPIFREQFFSDKWYLFKFQDYIWFAKNDFNAEEFNKRLRGFIYLQVSLASNFCLFVSSKAISSSLTDLWIAVTKLDIGWSWSFLFQISVESSSFWTRNLGSEVWTSATRAVQGDQEAAQEVGA